MMDSTYKLNNVHNKFVNLLLQRQIHEPTARILPRELHVTDNFIARLGLEKELEGHKGCVNCLEWNETGEILASASDDMHLILWDPFRHTKKLVFNTGHTGNIFSVKFLPKSNNTFLVTGAGDRGVRVHNVSLLDTIFICNCHTGRVKRIATVETVPFIFWTAAEDGLILQYDMRIRHNCKSTDRQNVLVDLVKHVGMKAEAKCLTVNPVKPELIAVGANDSYIRMYDRRMIKLSQIPNGYSINDSPRVNSSVAGQGDPDNNVPLGCAQYFIAGHLRSSKGRDFGRNYVSTYVTFSNNGCELLVNMGGEQVYLFDIENHRNSKVYLNDFDIDMTSNYKDSSKNEEIKKAVYGFNGHLTDLSPENIKELPKNIEDIKIDANSKFEQQQYTFAISLYNKAIHSIPRAAVLYANRAAAYMKRRWDGDIYSALRDCQMALLLDPDHVKAHFRLARCLFDLHRPVEAYQAIDDFQKKFPSYASNSSYRALRKDIKDAVQTNADTTNSYPVQISSHENEWRKCTIDHKLRFCGHCNTTTDIKEANFFGNDQYIIAGSDDGSFFIWDRYTTNIVRVLRGDDRIVNCLQPHPSTCFLATSGIDPVIRLWSPLPEDGTDNDREVRDFWSAASANQIRMNSDPFELMMMSMGYRINWGQTTNLGDGNDDNDTSFVQSGNCRTS